MNIGIPKERRPFEFRVGLPPAGVEILCQNGHKVYVEHEAGKGAGFSDQEYERVGATISYAGDEVFGRAELLLKVARPIQEELEWLVPGSTLAGLLHLASARKDKIDILLKKNVTALAYEQIQLTDGSFPVLRPFSQIGGMLAGQIAARLLQNNWGGKGILISGIPGIPPAEVAIIGAGVVGTYATRSFVGQGAHVIVLDQDINALQHISEHFPGVVTMFSTPRNIERVASYVDVLVGAVRISGARAPILVTRAMVQAMKPRSVILDLSIDEGGCVETSRPTTHDQPVYIEEGVLHYCVPNMPGATARTSTNAFFNVGMPYILEIANKGTDAAIAANPALAFAVTTHAGQMHHLSRLTDGKES
jgi:alanine dehydrogenase